VVKLLKSLYSTVHDAALPANIGATYSPICCFINYICLLPETAHGAALPCQHQCHTFPLSVTSPTTFACYLRLSMMPRSLSRLKRWKCAISANISATYSPIVRFINYICLLPETGHDAALPVPAEEVEVRDICQHQRHILPYRRIYQLHLLAT
jgi:hypothetical protein